MSRYAVVNSTAVSLLRIVESADPDDLARRVNIALSEINADVNNLTLTELRLAGAGDGHNFIVLLLGVLPANVTPIGPAVDPGLVRALCYMASDASELAVQRARAITEAGLSSDIIDEELAGAAQGERFMGIILSSPPL